MRKVYLVISKCKESICYNCVSMLQFQHNTALSVSCFMFERAGFGVDGGIEKLSTTLPNLQEKIEPFNLNQGI